MNKPKISIIVAVAKNNVIGCKNKLPWDLPADLGYFRQTTKGKPVIMGYQTHLSIGRVLPGRMNIVLCDRPEIQPMEGALRVESFEQAFDLIGNSEEAFIIGGASVYRQGMEFADRLYITEVDALVKGDTYFPDVDKNVWKETDRVKKLADDKNAYNMDFVIYEK